MKKRRTWFILVVAMLLATVGGYVAYIHFLAQAGTSQEPALQTVAEAIDTNSSTFTPTVVPTDTPTATPTPTVTPTLTPTPTPTHPLMIEVMRQQAYPGSEMTIEETLDPDSNYDRYIASYLSEGLKIYALLTVPQGEKPESGWPVVIFNHGYIPPDQYRTAERYVAYVDAFAKNGYIVFKSDYRGHGDSEGEAAGGYGSTAYTIDVLNAVSSIKNYPDADPDRIGMWGHSMGGHITLQSMVVTKDIKAGVIWAGVVASYPDLFERWHQRYDGNSIPTPNPSSSRRRWRQELFEVYGSPEENPEFWASISPNSYLSDLSGPIQLHHGTADSSVPIEFSETLSSQIQKVGKPVELYTYENDNHNISNHFGTAMERSIQFFDTYVKG
ncbi:MAG: alpha/beta hydrolase family protein [Anaerolineae bacterium]